MLNKYAVDKYANTNANSFDVTESIIKSTDDTTLLDPALILKITRTIEKSDRYKISLDLSIENLDSQNSTLPSLTSTKYIELVRYRNVRS